MTFDHEPQTGGDEISPFATMVVSSVSAEYSGCDCDCDCDAGDIDNY